MEEILKPSDSSFQRKVEEKVQEMQNLKPCTKKIDTVSFQFDGYIENPEQIFEIYAGIDELKPGQSQKIANDILKMLLYEKLNGKPVQKTICVVDNEIKERLCNGKSWKSKAIQAFGINVVCVPIDNETLNQLKRTKERQGISSGAQ